MVFKSTFCSHMKMIADSWPYFTMLETLSIVWLFGRLSLVTGLAPAPWPWYSDELPGPRDLVTLRRGGGAVNSKLPRHWHAGWLMAREIAKYYKLQATASAPQNLATSIGVKIEV